MNKAERLLKKKKKFEDKADRIHGLIEYRKWQNEDSLKFSGSPNQDKPLVHMAAKRDWKNGSLIPAVMLENNVIVSGVEEIQQFRDWLTEMLSDSLTSEMREIKEKNNK